MRPTLQLKKMNRKNLLRSFLTPPIVCPSLSSIFLLTFLWQIWCIQPLGAQAKQTAARGAVFESSTHKTINGTITDESGNPIIGASVIIKGTGMGTVTDSEGHYKLEVPARSVLKFSYIGFENKELLLGMNSTVNVQLTENNKALDEVVVIGYGNARKQDLSGAIATTKVTDIMKGRSSDLSSILQGQLPGLSVQANGGDPGSSNTLTIRGLGNRNGDAILIVVDGIPGAPYNVEDVESVSVLKDGATAAIYGATAGSGGVIIITTKKAKAGKVRVNANMYTGYQSAWKKPSTLNSTQYNQVWADAKAADGALVSNDVADLSLYPYGTTTRTNWVDEVFQTGKVDHYALSLSGGSDVMKGLLSVTYDNKEGIMLNTYKKSLGVKMGLDFQLTKWATLSENAVYQYSNYQGNVENNSHEGVLMAAISMPSSATVYEYDKSGNSLYNADGTPQYGGTIPQWAVKESGISGYGNIANPVVALKRMSQYNPSQQIHSTSSLELKPTSTINVRSDFSVDLDPAYSTSFNHSTPEYGLVNTQNSRTISSSWNSGWSWQTIASYTNTFADKHYLTAMLGHTMSYNKYRYNSTTTYGYASEDEYSQVETNATDWTKSKPTESISELSSMSVFGRLSYSYDDRYFMTASLRKDATSKLYSKNNSGTFPAVSGAWKVTSEDFFKSLQLPVSLLKVRASWGQVGNVSMVPNYSYNSTILTNSVDDAAPLGSTQSTYVYGKYLSTIANTDLKWETTETTDLGIDLNFLQDKLSLSADYYNKNTKNLIEKLNIPTQAGISESPYGNVGRVTNSGFELSAIYKQTVGKVQISVNGNICKNTNEVKSLGSLDYLGDGNPIRSAVCQPWYSFFLIKSAGIFQTQAQIDSYTKNGTKIQPNAQPGDLIFVDANGDGKITESDRQYCGSYAPKLTFGFGTSLAWNGFDFNIFFQGVTGNKIYSQLKQWNLNGGYTSTKSNMTTDVLKSWNYDKTSGYPRLSIEKDANGNFSTNSDFFLEDGSYLRLKNLSIGYTIPQKYLSKVRLSDSRFRIYVSGENLLTFTKYTGFDPEVTNSGVDGGTYPIARVISGGVNISF